MEEVSNEVYDIAKALYNVDDCDIVVGRDGRVEKADVITDYEDFNGYVMDCSESDFNKAVEYLKSLLSNVKFYTEYNSYLELSDNRTLNDVEIPEGQQLDLETFQAYVDLGLQSLENEINTTVYALGRSNRHICIEDNFDNLVNYSKYQAEQRKCEAWVLQQIKEEFNCYDETSELSLHKGEHADICLNCGETVIYTDEDIFTDMDGTYVQCPNCGASFDVDVQDVNTTEKEEAKAEKSNYEKGLEYLVNIAKEEGAKEYEIVEDTYEYPNGLMLIIYSDAEHEEEVDHICIDLDNLDEVLKEDCSQASGIAGKVTLFGSKDIKEEAKLTDYLGILQIRDILQKNTETANKEFAILDDMIIEVGTGDNVSYYKAIKNDDGEWELIKTNYKEENKQVTVEGVTTLSGTYDVDEYNKICDRLKQAYKDAWSDKISYTELNDILKKSGLSHAELQSIQYDASMEEDARERKENKTENTNLTEAVNHFETTNRLSVQKILNGLLEKRGINTNEYRICVSSESDDYTEYGATEYRVDLCKADDIYNGEPISFTTEKELISTMLREPKDYEQVIKWLEQIYTDIENGKFDKYKTKTEEALDNKLQEEEISQSISETVNTGVLPIVDTDMYSLNDVLPESATQEELDDIVKSVATPFIKENIQKVFKTAEVSPTGVYHPKQYNFSGDELEFVLSVSSQEFDTLKEKVLSDKEFADFIRETYSSSSGFISTMPTTVDEFKTAEVWQQLIQIIMFGLRNEELTDVNEAYLNDFLDAVNSEFPSDEELDESKACLGLSEKELQEKLSK